MLEKAKKILFYAGVGKEEYEWVKSKIYYANRIVIVTFSAIASLMILAMCLLSMFINSTSQNMLVYIGGLICSMALFSITFFYAKKSTWVMVPLVYISYSIFLIYGLVIGTITNPTQQTVTFMVMLVFLPMLFIDRSYRSILAILFYMVLFIILCFFRKSGDVLSTDVMDAIIFGCLGMISGMIVNHIKVRSYVLEKKLHDASRYDMLTQMNNRNSFETDMPLYEAKFQEQLICIYVDVNGLHELNNIKGHAMGDKMLQFVAECMKKYFGRESTYRVGGDEFIAFAVDEEEIIIQEKLLHMTTEIEEEGYHIAAGMECHKKNELNMEELVKAAEAEMYQHKSRYYNEGSNDRRKR